MDDTRPTPRVITNELSSNISPGIFSAVGGTPSWRSGPSPSPTRLATHHSPSTPLPPPAQVVPRSLTERESQLVKHLSRLQFFLATAPTRWMGSDEASARNNYSLGAGQLSSPHPNLNRFLLPNGEHVACVFWNGLYHITGTDIVRALVFRFEAFSRPVRNIKKFEEGIFSDLRNLKPGTDACLEEPKSPFLDLLFRNGCIRTQKKQKVIRAVSAGLILELQVFYWFSVPHDRLFLDALERDLKREKMGLEPTTVVVGEPARSFRYDPKRSLFEQFAGRQPGLEDASFPITSGANVNVNLITPASNSKSGQSLQPGTDSPALSTGVTSIIGGDDRPATDSNEPHGPPPPANTVLFSRSLFEGSPAYKQRRKKSSRDKRTRTQTSGAHITGYETGEEESESESDSLQQVDSSATALEDGLMTQSKPGDLQMDIYKQSADGVLPLAPGCVPPGPFPPVLAANFTRPPSSAGSHHHLHPQWNGVGLPAGDLDAAAAAAVYNANEHHDLAFQAALSTSIGSSASAGSTTKGFSCPLLSCGRIFKRLEHLKRHVRTHTQERPYECSRCSKRFSRSDNLTQHIKTHEKADRGERLKTEASEGNDEDMVTLLEAEVEAMVTREGSDVHADHSPAFSYQLGDHHLNTNLSRNHLYTQGRGSPAPAHSGHAGQGYHWNPWQPTFAQTIPSPAASALAKRHRSLTPSISQLDRTFGFEHMTGQLPSNMLQQKRYHPYHPSGRSTPGLQSNHIRPGSSVHRASSLGPGPMQPSTNANPQVLAQSRNIPDFPSFLNISEASYGTFADLQVLQPRISSSVGADSKDNGSQEANVEVHGLKQGANGDQVASQQLAEWEEAS